MDIELFCAIDRVVTYGHKLLLRRIRLEIFTLCKGKKNRTKRVASLRNCVHRVNGVRIAFKTLLGPLIEFKLSPLNVDIIWYQ
jgi:hypothetical protein